MQGDRKEPEVLGQNEEFNEVPTGHGGDGGEECTQGVALVS